MPLYKVVISGAARRTLIDQVAFLAAVNPAAAQALRSKLMREIRSLAQMPERFPYLEPENRKSRYQKMVVPDWHLVIYSVERDTVFVEYILDCRQDYQWLIAERDR